jgi:DNA-binding IscR family transcriptional regulator
MKEVRDRTAEILDGTSLDDLVQKSNRMMGAAGQSFMYHI